MITLSLDENTLERGLQAARKSFSCADNPAFRKTLVEAGVAGVVNALRTHFREREREPENRFGFPKFGQSYPKRYFWYGTRGTSVAERIRIVRTSPAALDGQVAVNSPALAHKLSTNPPPIVPKGGRKYLAIPASPEAAGWSGRPRDFPGGLRLAFWHSSIHDATVYTKQMSIPGFAFRAWRTISSVAGTSNSAAPFTRNSTNRKSGRPKLRQDVRQPRARTTFADRPEVARAAVHLPTDANAANAATKECIFCS